ncbi:MAG: hypothetical protein A2522_06525 [Gallionellales bacterium RIFOXYD12_FULL_53_10]|jgi:hypothetical protein|nr:MAG: hypothetical protein A2Z87_06360 [Gallionellales bacterium GWA2_54_124]OGS68891.1 MAG: hypothetical protein A2Z87_00020 [Gallionellales bacterium GWA2_54_124]OGT20191.1 MAG: hypothetical protein A2522_06525 [Gallionellales bacterium RIFOXYD12_FULL_53_10]OGT22824.1 MAG: hypothetical protein A3K00_04155 [Gallionellales bacterium RIFOXYD2_FULL_52_7]
MSQNTFELAVNLTKLAMELDYVKNSFPPQAKQLSVCTVEKLHSLASILAGDRAEIIYDTTEDTPGDYLYTANFNDHIDDSIGELQCIMKSTSHN